jgi:RNA polymerase subunit RPABC4/transcription elongation factor Spt4
MPQQQPVQQSPISSHDPQTSHTSGKKLESCGACGNLVARTATKCPQCGARTKSGSINDLVLAFVIIIVVLGAILSGLEYYFPNEFIL